MTLNGRNSSVMAIFMVLWGLVTLIVGYIVTVHEQLSLAGFFAGIGVVTLLLALLFNHSYTVGMRKLTTKEKENARKIAVSARAGGLWGGVGVGIFFILKYVFHWDTDPSSLIGGFGAACVVIGVMVLLDNLWLRAIFMWNNSDPHIRKLFGGK